MRWYVLAALLPAGAAASEKTFKHDQFPESISLTASQMTGTSMAVQAGYEQGEAFGQIYKPAAQDYPIRILGLDLVLADPPNQPGGEADAVIEVYVGEGDGPEPPEGDPDFAISTTELFNTATLSDGQPLVGNTAISITFDQTSDANHPPLITSGNIWVMMRYATAATDMSAAWGVLTCAQDFMGVTVGCGCQPIGTFHDAASTPGANILNFTNACNTPASQWAFMETKGVTGDLIMRLRAEVATTPTGTPDTDGTDPAEGGSTSPDGTDPADGDTTDSPNDDSAVAALSITSVSPPTAYAHEETDIVIAGTGFKTGARVLVGTTEILFTSLTGTGLIFATIQAELRPGLYAVAVINPDNATASLASAIEILAQPRVSRGCAAAPTALFGVAAVLASLCYRRRQ